ncbi:MAG: hypothetical protein JWQ19_3934 [Subtercola sp.]|nr:hypothetical protein [Subtercola sp.]
MAKMTTEQITDRLEKIALMVNRLDADLKAQFGEQAEVFFEADGGIHAMRGDCDGGAAKRQAFIIASSSYSRHGVGAW